MKKRGGGGVYMPYWGEKGFDCKSKKFSNNSAEARKMDTHSSQFKQKEQQEILYPVLLNTIIERILVVSNFSAQAGVLRIPKPFNIQLKYLSFRKPSSLYIYINFRASHDF